MEDAQHRAGVLDGLRGVAVLLLLLSQGGQLVPYDWVNAWQPLDSLVRSGSIATSLLMACSGFLVTSALLDAGAARGRVGVLRTFLSRLGRVNLRLALMLVTVLVVGSIDSRDPYGQAATQEASTWVSLHLWNWYVIEHPLTSRGDLVPVWLVSVETQFFIVLAALMVAWGRRRWAVMLLLVALVPIVVWWRWYILDAEGWLRATLDTGARMDGLVLGALAAFVLSRTSPWRRDADASLGAAALVLVGVVISTSFTGVEAYFGVQGLVTVLVAFVFLLAATHPLGSSHLAVAALNWRPIRAVGSAWLSLVIWYGPMIGFVARHSAEWRPVSRVLVFVALLGLAAWLTERTVKALHPVWCRIDPGHRTWHFAREESVQNR